MATIGERIKNGWNAFLGRDPTNQYMPYYGSAYRPDRKTLVRGNDRSAISSIYNQMAVDISTIGIRHVRLDEKGNYLETIDDPLNQALTLSANIDQSGRDLLKDIALSMFDEGVVAVVPVVTDVNPKYTDSYKIYELRTGKILEWFPNHVKVEVYNQLTGRREPLMIEKRIAAIIENPFYSIMNEPNSTAKRLINVMAQLDQLNGQLTSGKLDLIIQLPYAVKTEAKRKMANNRRDDVEKQLTGSQHGIAYLDATERIIQLNRPLENNLLEQAKDLRTQLYNQLGFTETIFNGTADEQTTLNYHNRFIEPSLSAIVEAMDRKWITKTARSQGQAIRFYRDPFKLVPVAQIAEIADKFTRNEIMSSNEIRSAIGLQPSDDPKADELRNANLNHPDENGKIQNEEEEVTNA